MIKMEINGFDKLKRNLNRLQKNAKNLDGKEIKVTAENKDELNQKVEEAKKKIVKDLFKGLE